MLPPLIAVARERGSDGRALIAGFVAGNEVMIRIGRATGHIKEVLGFHAPGTAGPFGATIAAGYLLRLDAAAMTSALGIAGSLAGGLLEFARGDGGMVKRLHLRRASEAGVLAASLAADSYEGPRTVLEAEFGFFKVFCTKWDREARDPELLRRDGTPRPADPGTLPARPAGAGGGRGARRDGEHGHDRARRRPPPRRPRQEWDARTRRAGG